MAGGVFRSFAINSLLLIGGLTIAASVMGAGSSSEEELLARLKSQTSDPAKTLPPLPAIHVNQQAQDTKQKIGPPVSAVEIKKALDFSRWRFFEDEDRVTGRKQQVLILKADRGFVRPQRRPGERVSEVFLRLSCASGRWTFYFTVNDKLVADHTARVTYRIDKQAPVEKQRWTRSADSTAVGFWNRTILPPIVRQLTKGNNFIIRVTNNIFGEVEADFSVKGLANSLKKMKCKS